MRDAWIMVGAWCALVACKDDAPPTSTPRPTASVATPAIDAGVQPVLPMRREPVRDLDAEVYRDMIEIPEGVLLLSAGPTDIERPMYSFYIDRTEVTVAQYRECVELGACRPPTPRRPSYSTDEECVHSLGTWSEPGHDDHPITCIDVADAYAYCRQRGKRLPTQVEWLYAARGTDKRTYPWGDKPPTCAQIAVRRIESGLCTKPATRPVGTTKLDRSPFGVLDMAGNVREFVVQRSVRFPPLAHDDSDAQVMGGGITGFDKEMNLDETGSLSTASPGTGFRCAAGGAPG